MLISRPSNASRPAPDAHLTPRMEVERRDGEARVVLAGNWTTRRVAHVDADIRKLENDNGINRLSVDLQGIGRIDTAGAWLINRLLMAMHARKVQTEISGASAAAKVLLDAINDAASRGGDSV